MFHVCGNLHDRVQYKFYHFFLFLENENLIINLLLSLFTRNWRMRYQTTNSGKITFHCITTKTNKQTKNSKNMFCKTFWASKPFQNATYYGLKILCEKTITKSAWTSRRDRKVLTISAVIRLYYDRWSNIITNILCSFS